MYSFSTCWNSHRHTDGRAMLREIRELGFEYAELSHGIRVSLMPGILDAVDAGEIKISTCHNFCPLPMGVSHAAPNLYEFTAERPRDQDLALRHTIKTIEFAARVKAQLVVLHFGSMDLKDYSGKLEEMLERGEKNSPKYIKIWEEAKKKRETNKVKPFARAIETLKKFLPEAEKRNIRLGIENREALQEIPLESDFHHLLREAHSPAVVYWHDCGHAQIKENLGFIDHLLHLESLADDLAGFHIHDVQFPAKDHCAPGTGMINFERLARVVKPHHIKVFEFGPALKTEQAKAGIAHIKKLWGE
jgi:sugar phosphate isomerase/epimerase